MAIKHKSGGAYTDVVGVFHKRAGAYEAVQGVYVKAAGVYGRVDAPAGPLDPFFANVTSLLHFDGANDSTDVPDNAPTPLTWTVTSPAKISTAQSVFGGASLDPGGGVIATPLTALGIASGDFTIEFSFRATTADRFIGGCQGMSFKYIDASSIRVSFQTSTESPDVTATGSFPANGWHAFAITRQGNTIRVFVNGSLRTTATVTGTINGTGWGWGRRPESATDPFLGYIDEARITAGVCRYTDSYTVESVAFPDA